MSISINSLSISYNKTPILTDISLEIAKGEFIALLGKNGSGKSTLAHSIMGLIPHAIPAEMNGTVTVHGKDTQKTDIGTLSQHIGIVFQDPSMVIFNPTVREEILFGIINNKRKNPEEHVKQALKDVGLEGYEERDPQTLSEGQKQKLCIACVLAMGTDMLVLDEPISHLDYLNACMIYDLLKKLNKQGKTIIVIEHDTDFVLDYTDRTCVLHEGTIVINGKTKDMLKQNEKMKQYGVKPILRYSS